MDRRMRRLFDDSRFAFDSLPAADVYETTNEFVVELEVPGFAEQDLGLEITDHTLIVRGEAKQTKEEQEKTFLLRERLERTFERRFFLPEQADTEKLTATFKEGVLELHAPKIVAAKPRKITIGKK